MDKELYAAALAVREKAYAPYSKFCVGAAVRTADNNIYVGCNVENASYGLTCCAERNAIYAAVAAGEKSFKTLCVAAATAEPVAPCGACRQVMSEFGIDELFLANCEGKVIRMTLKELLPYSFSSESLKK
ncbi:MAG: cytidine deaminase [Acidaminococcaceae bacterium]